MSFDLVWDRRVAVLRCLAVLLLSAAGCGITPPSDRIACVEHSDCPEGFYCNARSDGQRRCGKQQLALDAGLDSGSDAALRERDAGDEHDAGHEHAAGKPATDASSPMPTPDEPPPRHDDEGGQAPPTAMEELPPLLRMALPECAKTPDPSNAYFVSPGVGEDVANCGGPMGPCRSIHKALQRAGDDGVPFVYLDNTDVYVEPETLQLQANVIVVGGFSNVNGRWTRLCDSSRGKTRLMSSGNPVFMAELRGTARVVTLHVEQRPANAGETMIGVFARGATTQLGLEDVSVAAADGGAGVAGAAGTTLPSMNASCSASDGADGAGVGATGGDAVSGSFSAQGYTPADGVAGGQGAPGNASASTEPTCHDCPQSCDPPCGLTARSCGTPGTPGCGGAAGSGGAGGLGGGSSIALYAWDAQVFVSGGSLQAGAGGNGGAGGAAGKGVAGGVGSAGAPGEQCSICAPFASESSVDCITYADPTLGMGGPAGAAGGSGRDGGPGGSGAPGASFAAYGGGTARLEIAAETVLMHGDPGTNAAGILGPVSLRAP